MWGVWTNATPERANLEERSMKKLSITDLKEESTKVEMTSVVGGYKLSNVVVSSVTGDKTSGRSSGRRQYAPMKY